MVQYPHDKGAGRCCGSRTPVKPGPSSRAGVPLPLRAGVPLLRRAGRRTATLVALALGLALIFISGCTGIRAGSQETPTKEPGTLLFSDDFSNPPGGWGTWKRGGATVDYYNGGLRILVAQDQFDFWSVAGQKFADASIEVDATKNSGPDNNDFGIVCRYQNKDNFYLLVASSDGYYGIAKMAAGQYSMIGADQLQYSSIVAHGRATNHLRADCIGSTLVLFFNGEKLIEAQDHDFTSGDVGVIAGAYATPGVDILFDNFEVRKP